MHARLFHLHTLSALHCGTGRSVGVVDLPIARARATQLPIVPGSSLRGVLRQEIGARDADLERTLFGPRTIKDNANSFAGALAVGDAHLLAMPVRALAGILCYVTAPFILRRYARDLADVGLTTLEIPSPANREHALVPTDSVNLLDNNTLVLEDLDLGAQRNALTLEWARIIAARVHPHETSGQTDFIQRFAILPDDILGYLSETATELRTRISIDQDTGTVKKGALWFEEHLPAESVLWGLYALSDSNEPGKPKRADALAQALPASPTLLQLGGQAGVGRGLVRLLTQEVAA
ncbi:type III-B CRISPR module RAMP protein Cmr4 [Allochromatium tepidum]|uniref:Type III-B CRISPR module RAMP protein Cmr4 n=1 Tax=Allochromatium tepidum TaxID=553982 RepID=A0ABN6GEJ5_9GAMM|nr:type III-B CRISPR module RAMP protein Cmr4 [Allochromatium tepidum]BCU08377.1 type III-B CRISPR module RAMP protein Cmr4 [Allochromatium tepidum]